MGWYTKRRPKLQSWLKRRKGFLGIMTSWNFWNLRYIRMVQTKESIIRFGWWQCNTSYVEVSSVRDPTMVYPSLSKERRGRESYRRNSSRDLWSSYEWENISQEDLENRVLLEHNGDQLCRLSEDLPWLTNTCEFESRAT